MYALRVMKYTDTYIYMHIYLIHICKCSPLQVLSFNGLHLCFKINTNMPEELPCFPILQYTNLDTIVSTLFIEDCTYKTDFKVVH